MVKLFVRLWLACCAVFGNFGCFSGGSVGLFETEERFESWREYEEDFSLRLRLYFELAEQELEQNFAKKKYLMIRREQPEAVIHPRQDITLRELVQTAHGEGKIDDGQRDEFLEECDKLHRL